MRRSTPLLLAAAALLALAPAAAHAQREGAVRDTIRFGAPRAAANGDSIVMADPVPAEDTVAQPARRRTPDRWARPFEVEGSGRPAPLRREREVVWIHPDSIARPDSAGSVDEDGEAEEGDTDEIALDTTATAREDDPPASRRRTSSAEETESSTASRRRASSAEGEEEAPASSRRRTASSEEGGSSSSSSSTRRRASSAEGEEETPPASNRRRTTTSEEGQSSTSSNRRRTASADAEEEGTPAASRRRASSRDTASSGRSTSRTASRETADSGDEDRPADRPAATSGRGRTHTVAAGETFFGIARRYGVTTAQLRALNPSVEWEALEVGTVLRLPAAARERGQSATTRTTPSASDGERRTTTTTPARATGRRTHTVERGETLFGIARRYGVTVAALRQANDLDEDQGIRAGQTLAIPAAPRQR